MATFMGKKLMVGAILSSQDLIDKINKLAKMNFDSVSAKLIHDFTEVLPLGVDMENKGADVIITGRGMAEFLRTKLHIPVFALVPNSLDILVTMKRAVTFGRKIFITNFRKKLSGMDILEEIFNVKIIQGVYKNFSSIENLIVAAKERKVDAIVGGNISVNLAHLYGLQGIEYCISEENVIIVIENALSAARMNHQEQEKLKRFHCIIDSSQDAIISINQYGNITTINTAGKKLLSIKDENINSYKLLDYLPASNFMKIFDTKQPIFNKLEEIKGDLYLTNHLPITVHNDIAGIVSIFKHSEDVIKDENEIRKNFAKGFTTKYTFKDLTYSSPIMRDLAKKVIKYSTTDSTILINGETGTGKEIIAQSIHNMGDRARGPFVSINCAAIPNQLLENELFGHDEGSFTGARKGGKMGFFELAHNGSIFLDEIASTPENVQASLLRVLQEKRVMRIGSDRLIPINVRVLAASNKNLAEEVRSGRFRKDLFYRLNVLALNIPPLRNRIEDMAILVEELIKRISKQYQIKSISIPEQYIKTMMQYPWPGNIRQLENFLERLLLLSDSTFDPDILEELFQENEINDISNSSIHSHVDRKDMKQKMLCNGKKTITETLIDTKYCKTKAAKMLGISRTTLWRKMKTLNS